MQSSFTWSFLFRAACGTASVLVVSACNNGTASGGTPGKAGPAATPATANAAGYMLVMQTRPEEPEKSFPHERALYKACVAVAGRSNMPVKPFPTLPPNFVRERRTYASDGARTMVRKVAYYLDMRKASPQEGCELRLAGGWDASLTSEGQQRSAGTDEDGNVHLVAPEPVLEEPVRASLLASYTIPKRINAVPLKCSVEQICTIDPAVAVVAEGSRPVQVAFRIDDPRTYGTALITEPVSFRVGRPVDPAVFSLERVN